MKKLFSTLVFIGFLTAILLPVFTANAQTTIKTPEKCTMKRTLTIDSIQCTGQISIDDPEKAICCVMNTMYNITDWIFVILVGLAGIFVIIGAMTLLMAAGAPEKVTTGRNYIMYAAIGLIVALLAKAIPGLVRLISGI